MSALQALRTSDRTFPRHQGWKVYEIVPPVGCPPSKRPFRPKSLYIIRCTALARLLAKCQFLALIPLFLFAGNLSTGGGLARVLNIHLFQNEHPVWTSTWTSTPSKSPFFILFAPLLKPHLKPVLMPFSHRSNLGAYKAPVRPKHPCTKGFHTYQQKRPHA